jgi:branched-chain amino acid aminotransferase
VSREHFPDVQWIWMNGRLVEFEKATIHVLSHALHYGSGVFEGIRCYKTKQGPAVFRLPEHVKRLANSAKIYRMELPWSQAEIGDIILETIRANEFSACYIRPLIFRGFGQLGLNPLNAPVEMMVAAWPWARYLGDEAADKGVDVCISSWRRAAPSTFPATAKATGNYLNAQLVKMEAVANGYAEGIGLDISGHVSEGAGENLFLVKDGVLITPPVASSLLSGITRDAVLKLAADLSVPAREQLVPRGQLYVSDEMFFTGTAVEIAPIRSVDRITVGDGRPGEITRRLQAEFQRIITGETPDRHGWLTPVGAPAEVTEVTEVAAGMAALESA